MEKLTNDQIRELILNFLYHNWKKARSLKSLGATSSEIKKELKNARAHLDEVEIILSGAIPEGMVLHTTYCGRHIICIWCMMEEDEMIEALMREFTGISIEETLKRLGCSEEIPCYVFNALMGLSVILEGLSDGA